ncbi:MAG: gliding motility ABC transporter, partial [Proteobacteria bacterium]
LEDAKEATGLNAWKMMVENNRYILKPLALNLTAKIPEDADVIAIVNPTQNFLDYEILGLQEYLKNGGSIFMALKAKQTVGLDKILKPIGIEPMNNYVLNLVQTQQGAGIQQGQTLGTVFSANSEITKVFGKNDALIFRNPMSFRRTTVPEGVTVDEIIKAPESSMSFDSLKIAGDGPQGAYTLAMTAQGKFPGSASNKPFSMVLVGDTDFMANQLLGQTLNRDLALNSLASLAKEENLISISPKESQVTKMMMTETMFYVFLLAFAIPLPVALLGTSITLWMKRRHA